MNYGSHYKLQQPDVLETFHHLQENSRRAALLPIEKSFVSTNKFKEQFKMSAFSYNETNPSPVFFQKLTKRAIRRKTGGILQKF